MALNSVTREVLITVKRHNTISINCSSGEQHHVGWFVVSLVLVNETPGRRQLAWKCFFNIFHFISSCTCARDNRISPLWGQFAVFAYSRYASVVLPEYTFMHHRSDAMLKTFLLLIQTTIIWLEGTVTFILVYFSHFFREIVSTIFLTWLFKPVFKLHLNVLL